MQHSATQYFPRQFKIQHLCRYMGDKPKYWTSNMASNLYISQQYQVVMVLLTNTSSYFINKSHFEVLPDNRLQSLQRHNIHTNTNIYVVLLSGLLCTIQILRRNIQTIFQVLLPLEMVQLLHT